MNSKFLFFYISVFFLTSCSNSSFEFTKSDYFLMEGKRYIRVKYNPNRELHQSGPKFIMLKNEFKEDIYVFSTVLENTPMLYSQKNYTKNKKKLKLNSYYKNYMKDATHSGIRKFNFIPIASGDSLIVNLEPSFLSDVEEIEFTYYYLKSLNENLYIQIDELGLQIETMVINLE